MKAIIEYSNLKEVEKKKIDVSVTKVPHHYIQFCFIVYLIIFICIPNFVGVPLGISLSAFIYFIKYIIDKKQKEQFSFLPEPDKNYIDIPYKSKLQAIDFKITCHPESNPVRIMQNESNRLYVFSNSSDSLINKIL